MKLPIVKFLMVCVAGLVLQGAALAQSYPSKPIRLIVGYLPGGVVDSIARLIQNDLSKGLGQQVIINNIAGASGAIGAADVARAAPDGYTMLMIFDNHALAPLLTHNAHYDAFKDFTFISVLVKAPMVAVVRTGFPASDLKDLVAYAKANPGKVTYGSAGAGTSSHLTGELFDHAVGVSMTPIFYKGGADVQIDLMGGRLDLFWAPTSSVTSLMRTGKVKILGQASATRSSAFPDVKTVAQEGLPAVEAISWIGIGAPANLPRAILDRWHAELVKVSHDPAIIKALHDQGYDPVFSTPAESSTFIHAQYDKWKRVIDAAHITAN